MLHLSLGPGLSFIVIFRIFHWTQQFCIKENDNSIGTGARKTQKTNETNSKNETNRWATIETEVEK